ncbi:hypothetical protein scyTo_0016741 [Scyliorhinus torazame]|uniref:Uncharacterized protein n=1 Tax=Scyliorhinus torazame TaxID=75743 RepID=A0A401PXC7_SCYTO|nr:hypothetical protein [Scyliorhinus torazame]
MTKMLEYQQWLKQMEFRDVRPKMFNNYIRNSQMVHLKHILSAQRHIMDSVLHYQSHLVKNDLKVSLNLCSPLCRTALYATD